MLLRRLVGNSLFAVHRSRLYASSAALAAAATTAAGAVVADGAVSNSTLLDATITTTTEATAATTTEPASRLTPEHEELQQDLDIAEQIDADGSARPDRICPCLQSEIDACGSIFLKSFGCALLYRRDFSQSSAECMSAHSAYIECKERFDDARHAESKTEAKQDID